jgi:hypothetical protein
MGFLRKKAAGYKAAVRVEKHRAAAVEMRQHDPETYATVLAQADGSEAEGAARRDPDAYVALFLAAYEDVEDEKGASEPVQGGRDNDHWPDIDLDAVWADINTDFREGLAERGATQLYFPRWAVRSLVTMHLMAHVSATRPDLHDEYADLLTTGAESDGEDPVLEARVDAFLARNHLSQIVEAIVQGLSAEE